MIEPNRQGECGSSREQEDGLAARSSALELCGNGPELAGRLGVGRLAAVAAGVPRSTGLPGQLIAQGADKVSWSTIPRLAHFRPFCVRPGLTTNDRETRPQIVMYGATALGRDLAPVRGLGDAGRA